MPELVLGKRRMRCIEVLPPGVIFDLAEGTHEGGTLKAVAAFSRFLRAVVMPADQDLLREALYDTQPVLSYDELNEAAGGLVAEYTGRPTQRPSASPGGSTPTTGPSRVVSLSRATAAEGATSSTAGQPAGY